MRSPSEHAPRRALTIAPVKALADGGFDVPASTEATDSHREEILVKGWDLTRYSGKKNGGKIPPRGKGNPVILYGHNYMAPPIGRAHEARKVLDGKRPELRIAYRLMEEDDYGGDWPSHLPSPPAIAAMLRSGYLRGHSVGFTPIAAEPMDPERPWGPQRYLEQSLNELSVVTLPSNAECLDKALSQGFLRREHLPGVYSEMDRYALDLAGEPEMREAQTFLRKELEAPRSFYLGSKPPRAPEAGGEEEAPPAPRARTLAELTIDELPAILRAALFDEPDTGDEEDESAEDDSREPQQRAEAEEDDEDWGEVYDRLVFAEKALKGETE